MVSLRCCAQQLALPNVSMVAVQCLMQTPPGQMMWLGLWRRCWHRCPRQQRRTARCMGEEESDERISLLEIRTVAGLKTGQLRGWQWPHQARGPPWVDLRGSLGSPGCREAKQKLGPGGAKNFAPGEPQLWSLGRRLGGSGSEWLYYEVRDQFGVGASPPGARESQQASAAVGSAPLQKRVDGMPGGPFWEAKLKRPQACRGGGRGGSRGESIAGVWRSRRWARPSVEHPVMVEQGNRLLDHRMGT